jgi:ABC-type Fe3+-hydroxamate transport system substrate-binding protein
MSIRDVRGKTFDTARPPQRIVSLVPSVTETLFAFGAGERVVGVTDYCIHPAEGVAAKTRVGGTKNPRVEQILALDPDLVLANIEENRKPDIETLEAHGVPVYITFPRTVRMALDELRLVAELVGAENAAALVEPIARRLDGLKPPGRRARVFVAIWRDPWMTVNGDTFVGDLIETCGGENIFRERQRKFPLAADLGRVAERPVEGADTRYPRVSLEEVASLRPEVILLPDEPYRFTGRDAQDLHATPGLEGARLRLLDGTLVTWSGIRMGRALDVLPGLLEP